MQDFFNPSNDPNGNVNYIYNQESYFNISQNIIIFNFE